MISMPAMKAAIEFLKLKERYIHPAGHFDKGKWYPKLILPCCQNIRSPSRAHPWSLMTHCRSAIHVAQEFGVNAENVKNCVRKKNLPLLLGMDSWADNYISKIIKGST